MNPAELLAAFASVPRLPGALCLGEHQMFDLTAEGSTNGATGAAEVAQARAEALALCGRCEAITACRAWVTSLPPRHRPLGVCGGQIHLGRGQLADPDPHITTDTKAG